MRSVLGALICIGMALAGPPSALAYHFIGATPSESCGTWGVHRQENQLPEFLDTAWLLGFLAGIGASGTGDPLAGVDANGVLAWVDNYCHTHPLKTILDAGTAFYEAHPR